MNLFHRTDALAIGVSFVKACNLNSKYGSASFEMMTGTVVHVDKGHSTEVWSEGGGGYVTSNGGGYVRPPVIKSAKNIEQDFYIKDDLNNECRFSLTNWNVDARPGSRLRVAFRRLGRGVEVLRVQNLDTGNVLESVQFKNWLWSCGAVPRYKSSFWYVVILTLLGAIAVFAGCNYYNVTEKSSPWYRAVAAAEMKRNFIESKMSRLGYYGGASYIYSKPRASKAERALADEYFLAESRLNEAKSHPMPSWRDLDYLPLNSATLRLIFNDEKPGIAWFWISIFTLPFVWFVLITLPKQALYRAKAVPVVTALQKDFEQQFNGG